MKNKKRGILAVTFLLLLLMCLSVQAKAYTGFKTSANGVIRYYDTNGKVVKGKWFKVNKKSYYAKPDGSLATGLIQIKNKWYYFNKAGANVRGWKTIKGKRYYFFSETKAALTGLYTFKGKNFSCIRIKVVELSSDGKYSGCHLTSSWRRLNEVILL